jgi:hypothetical protein
MSEQLHLGPDTLSAFVEGALPEHERGQCLAHLAECSHCREIVFLVPDTPAVPVVSPAVIRPPWGRPMPLLAAAAAVCFVVLGAWLYVRSKTERPPTELAARSAPAPEVKKPAEVGQPKSVAKETAPRVAPRPWSEHPNNNPASPAPSSAPATSPEVAHVAPPSRTADSAEAAVQALPPPPARASQIQIAPQVEIAPLETLSGISGTVTDATGAAIPHAAVELRQLAGITTANAQTDDAGNFKFTGLAPGRYEVRIAMTGFRLASQQVDVRAHAIASVRSQLEVGSTTETVEVTAAPSTLQTESASVSRSPRRKQATPPEPRPLPSKLPAERMVAQGKKALAVDSAGTLFFSENAGKSWKAVKPPWRGKVAGLVSPPDVDNAGPAQFQLTTDAGVDWLSRDGRHWYSALPEKK